MGAFCPQASQPFDWSVKMLSLVVSTITFFASAWFLNRYLDDQNIAKGMTRNMLVFTLAAMLSWGSGELADWADARIYGPRSVAQPSGDFTQLLNASGKM
jgi:hypothetical protein